MKIQKRVFSLKKTVLFFTCLIFLSGCSKGVNSEKAISKGEIYPTGNIETAKIFDESHNEQTITLNQDDLDYLIKIVKSADKELVDSYSNAIELNISLSDSTIQLIRADSETLYYVFHNSKINAVCYKFRSKELSEWILNLTF